MATQPRPSLRESRERELIAATRNLFDERGTQDAPVEEIARAVGIARGLIYRQFSSKEELFVLTVTDYLAELADELEPVTLAGGPAPERLDAINRAFLAFCTRYPAFLDCALSLMRRPVVELRADVSASVMERLTRGMVSCIDQLAQILQAGVDEGYFDVADVDVTANVMWAQHVGAMHLARVGTGVRERSDGRPAPLPIDADDLRERLVAAARAQVS